jgi:oxygen-independent coproporphyrinogen-3 oxidase
MHEAGARAAGPSLTGARARDVPLALYVHLPWCVRKCPYCDFNSHQLKTGQPDVSYIDALIRDFEIEARRIGGREIVSVFFGGGTPSLFLPEEFARLIRALKERAAFADDAEITLEANPGTVERGRFSGYAQAGINRVSLGAQSFDARALKELGRIHSAEDTHRAVEEIKAAGLTNFNLDLMYALPGQTLEEALNDVRTAMSLAPAHISYYQLTLEPGTVFHARPPVLPDEDAAWQIQVAGQRALADAGFAQYEVSAYAKEGARCRHNLNYWLFGDYVGIGAGAHGKLSMELPQKIVRTVKPKQPREYQDQIRGAAGSAGGSGAGSVGASGVRSLGKSGVIAPEQLPFEYMLNALRLNEGFCGAEYEARTGLSLQFIEEKLERARSGGLLERNPQGWRPTDLGLRFLNDLQAAFLA